MKAKKLFPDISFRRLVRPTVPVDNLESTDVDRPLSANMGREVKEQIDENTNSINELNDRIDDINEIKTTTITSDYTAGNVTLKKIGSTVSVMVDGFKDIPLNSSILAFVIPSGFRPPTRLVFQSVDSAGAAYRFQFLEGGNVYIYAYISVNNIGNLVDTFTFPSIP